MRTDESKSLSFLALGLWLCAAGLWADDVPVPEQADLLKLVQGKNAKPEELLVGVYEQPLGTIEREWKEWIAGQPIDGNVNLVLSSFVKTETEWRAWWQENKERLMWDETREIYRVR